MEIYSTIRSNRFGVTFNRRFCAATALPAVACAIAVGLFGCSSAGINSPLTPEQSAVPMPRRQLPEKISAMRFPPRLETALRKSINARLKFWQASVEARDINKHLQFYADEIEFYYLSPNVGKDVVRADRERAFEQFDTLKMQLVNVDISLQSKDEATVIFDKTWDFKKAANFSNGLVQQEVKMRKIEKQWFIVSEKDLEIYRYHNN